MKQVFAHYTKWEDFQNGMYKSVDVEDKHLKLIGAINLLCDTKAFYVACKSLLQNWEVSSGINMTNISQNRRAWLGAAACCFVHSTPEYITRVAWSMLNKVDQDKANAIADLVISEYEQKYNKHEQTEIRF